MRVKTTGPKCFTVYEMRYCVSVEESESTAMCSRASGWRLRKATEEKNAPFATDTVASATLAKEDIDSITCNGSNSRYLSKIASWKCGVQESSKMKPHISSNPAAVVSKGWLLPSVSKPNTTKADRMTRTSA